MTRTIYRRDLPHHPRLGRHIHHDSASRRFAFNTAGLDIVSVRHERHIPVLDQGQVGSCTGNAGVGALATTPTFEPIDNETFYSMDERGAVKLYSDAEDIDGDGPYPPNDNGSCGLSIAKACKTAKLISGYQWTFNPVDALKALSVYPTINGFKWYEVGFDPDPDGRVHIGGRVAGGHEVEGSEIDAPNQRVWFWNSWGDGWGDNGRFYLTFDDYATLLEDQGDCVVLLPVTVPAPQPTPSADVDPEDIEYWNGIKDWVYNKHTFRGTRDVADRSKTWAYKHGLIA